MLFEGAIGDAFAAGFKWADERFVRRYLFSNYYIQNPKYKVVLGNYNDQMPIAIAELVLEGRRWTPKIIADKFCEVYKRDRRQGGRFADLLSDVKDGRELLKRVLPNSDKNGAAMRSPALGYMLSVKRALQCAETHARVTHDTKAGIDSAKAVAVMAFFREERKKIPERLNKYVPQEFDWKEMWDGPVPSHGIMCVHAAISSVLNHDSLTDILRACISYTGDVEAVASIALSIASCCPDVKQDLPQELVDGLENDAYGRDYLIDLDSKLKSR